MNDITHEFIDHINGDRGDNRIEILRECNKLDKYQAYIRKDNIKIHLCTFITAIDAAKSYDDASKKYHGQFAKLNFLEV